MNQIRKGLDAYKTCSDVDKDATDKAAVEKRPAHVRHVLLRACTRKLSLATDARTARNARRNAGERAQPEIARE